jgi:hypothetical protein
MMVQQGTAVTWNMAVFYNCTAESNLLLNIPRLSKVNINVRTKI